MITLTRNQYLNEDTSLETVKTEEEMLDRKAELKGQGYTVLGMSKVSKGFTAMKKDDRIIVRISESKNLDI